MKIYHSVRTEGPFVPQRSHFPNVPFPNGPISAESEWRTASKHPYPQGSFPCVRVGNIGNVLLFLLIHKISLYFRTERCIRWYCGQTTYIYARETTTRYVLARCGGAGLFPIISPWTGVTAAGNSYVWMPFDDTSTTPPPRAARSPRSL